MTGKLCTATAVAARHLRRMHLFLFVGVAVGMPAAISACTTGDVFNLTPAVDVGTQTAAVTPAPEIRRSVPSTPAEAAPAPEPSFSETSETPAPLPDAQGEPAPVTTVAYPRIDRPETPSNQLPADEIDCRRELRRLGVAYTDVAPIHGGGQCGIDHPVKVTAIGSIQMKPAATLTCNMAATFAGWTKRELVPAARLRYWSGVKAIHQGSSYSCRNIAGEGVLSEHGKGNALDVMSIELNNGDNIDVRKPGLFAFRTRGFLNTVRADGCQYFTTVLGPGYNYDHRNHFHFDIKNRRNGYRACR